jgi:hypothetical protein
MNKMVVLEAQSVLVEQVGGRFTLIAQDGDTDVFIPLDAEGADLLRADMNETIDTADQETAVERSPALAHGFVPSAGCGSSESSFARRNVDPISTNQRSAIVARVAGASPGNGGSSLVLASVTGPGVRASMPPPSY